ncbi:RNA polymerase sigma factor [Immundisolibacter sp.]|uniref:RNA polymerase sigma factor n=1 Tax=Immundisolibacter sp. TaxID=1934948 RepID=UPI003F860093
MPQSTAEACEPQSRPRNEGNLAQDWDESALLARLRAGDQAAFQHLVQSLNDRLSRVARGLVGPGAADDVVQDTWEAVLKALPRFEARASLSTWVLRILTNTAISRLRRAGREVASGDFSNEDDMSALAGRFADNGHWHQPPHPWHADTPDALLGNDELQAALTRAIDQLPHNQRAVLTLRELAGQPLDEICNALDISASNARVLLHRARLRVWAAIDAYQRGEDV